MRKNQLKKLGAILLSAVMLISLTACGNNSKSTTADKTTEAPTAATESTEAPTKATENTEVKTVTFGIETNCMPNAYVDEDGNLAGQNYEVMTLVDQLLPQYEFKYDPVSPESVMVGIDSGKYAGGIGNYFYNDDRAAKYLFPKEPISGGVRGVIVKTENAAKIKTLQDVADLKLKAIPVNASESAYTLLTDWNNKNSDKKIEFEVGEETPVGEAIKMIMEGRYGCAIFLKSNYDDVKTEVDPDGQTSFACFDEAGFGTWVLYNKDQQELVAAIDGAMKQLYADGTMTKLSEKYYGEDVYQYIPEEKRPDGYVAK